MTRNLISTGGRLSREDASVARPLTKAEKAAILHDLRKTFGTIEGTYRAVAGRHGCSPNTVARIARDNELTSESGRAKVQNATKARQAQMAEQRARISEMLLNEAERALQNMHEPHLVFNFGGKDNSYNEKTLPSPPTGDQRNLATIAAIMLDKHKMLDTYDDAAKLMNSVDSWLTAMAGERSDESGD